MHPSSDVERFKTADASSYNSVTGAFDRYTERYTAPLAQALVKLARLEGNERVLDVGSGTGIASFAALSRLSRGGLVFGIDLSDGMLAFARAKAAGLPDVSRVEFQKADAESLPFSSASFDTVISLFTMLHLPNPQTALGEMHRVLRPGGRLVLGFGAGPSPLSASLALRDRAYLGYVIARLRRRCLVAPAFLHELLDGHGLSSKEEEAEIARVSSGERAHALSSMTRLAGFASVRTAWRGNIGVLDSAEEFWELQNVYSSRARKSLASVPAATVHAIRTEFLDRAAAMLRRGGRLLYPVGMRVIIAQKAG